LALGDGNLRRINLDSINRLPGIFIAERVVEETLSNKG